ncbi:MAG: ion transporter [Bacteroidales bacterium]|nr:ion transporter [Bacteroidales bacterium]
MSFRKRIYDIVEPRVGKERSSVIYDTFMLIMISLSILPLCFAKTYPIFHVIEIVTVSVFVIDYILRWCTADYKLGKGAWSFLIYPFTPAAIIDILSILPALSILSQGFKLFRLNRLLRLLRILKFFRYSDKFELLWHVIKREKNVLLTVLGFCIFYIFVTGLIMFNAEPHISPITGQPTFASFFDALYWATVTLTTVGYGDLTPVTDIGRLISMLSSLFGVAIIALPSGVITASYLDELRSRRSHKNKPSPGQDKPSEDGNSENKPS